MTQRLNVGRGLFLTFLCLLAARSARGGGPESQCSTDGESLGRSIFVHNWARPESWTEHERLGKDGDGLGPVFNEVSCVACHSLGGVGGAGGNEHNVDLLSLVMPRGISSAHRRGLIEQAKTVHPQMAPGNTTLILHQFAFGPQDDTRSYDMFRASLMGGVPGTRGVLSPEQPFATILDVPLRLSQRNTPALWGTGLIERLRRGPGNRLRRAIVLEQNGSSTGVSGRIPRTASGRSAWFGWRGHVAHLPEFVMTACAHELGLAVTRHPQPESPIGEPLGPTASRRLDLTNSQVVELTRYVASLPRPEQVLPTDVFLREDVRGGEQVFSATGCAECHVPDMGPVKAIFSDLLLHDMGTSLSDLSTAFPERPSPRQNQSGGYSGGSGSLGSGPIRTNLAQEWRTPPLWGVADSAPYLHDGRAETLDEAILLHGGEAWPARNAYRDLPEKERSNLLVFLGTLRAPQLEGVAVDAAP